MNRNKSENILFFQHDTENMILRLVRCNHMPLSHTGYFYRYFDKDWQETREMGDGDETKKETDRDTYENTHEDKQREI